MTTKKVLRALLGDPQRGRPSSHAHVLGASGSGKSKYLQSLFRTALNENCGIVLIDPAGSLYREDLKDLAYLQPNRKVVLIDTDNPRYIVPYNPLKSNGWADAGTHASRLTDLIMKNFEAANTNQTPLLARGLRLVFHYMEAAEIPPPVAVELLDFEPRMVEHALQVLNTPEHRQAYRLLCRLLESKSIKAKQDATFSTDNRLTRFLDNQMFLRFMGIEPTLDMRQLLDDNAVIVANLGQSSSL